MQNTRLKIIQEELVNYFVIPFKGPWKVRSLGLITLLLGFYLSSNISSYIINKQGERIGVLLIMLITIEILIRLRPSIPFKNTPLHWIAIDNLRIGSTYAIVLEAFKLGS
tara:strand:+ start:2929 stop:3258 length:330 start_codon:yes stop_codon:yes gene_type:complete